VALLHCFNSLLTVTVADKSWSVTLLFNLGLEDLPDFTTGLKALSWLLLILECWLTSSRSPEFTLFLCSFGAEPISSFLVPAMAAVTGVTVRLQGVTTLNFPGQNN
jgi:hypothetical protein